MSTKKKTPGKSVAILPVTERAVAALGQKERETELVTLAASTLDIVEITNDAGYKQVRGARLALKNIRVEIRAAGKAARDDATKFSKAVIAEEDRLVGLIEPEETRLSVLEGEHEKKEAAAEQARVDAEVARQEALQARVDALRALPNGASLLTAAEVQTKIDAARALVVDESFDEKQDLAAAALVVSIHALVGIHVERVAHEAAQAKLAADLADLERLRVEDAQRKADQAEADRKAQVARDAEAKRHADQLLQQAADAAKEAADRQAIIDANNARVEAAQKAAQAALDAEAKRQADERAEIETARQAGLDLLAAVAKAKADAQAEIDRQREELSNANEPAPEIVYDDSLPAVAAGVTVTHVALVEHETGLSVDNELGCPCHGLEGEGDTCRDICKAQKTAAETRGEQRAESVAALYDMPQASPFAPAAIWTPPAPPPLVVHDVPAPSPYYNMPQSSPVTPITDAVPFLSAAEYIAAPSRDDILNAIANFFGVDTDTALEWNAQYDWRAALAKVA
jgi:hypothetical protein